MMRSTSPRRGPFVASALALLVGVALAGSGCGADADPSASGEAGSGGAASSGGSSDLEAPVLLEVAPFSLSLKITWELHGPCDSILGERRTATEPYAPAFEAQGTDTVYVDDKATQDQTYTYKLRCKLGEALSPYSNEKTGNPMKF